MSHHEPEELSNSARALIDETRELDDPAPGDRDRVKRALLATIASGGAVAASTAASGTAAATTAGAGAATAGGVSMGVKLAAVAFVAAAAVGGTAVVVTTQPDPAEETHQVAERTRAPAAEEAAPVAAPAVDDADDALEPVVEAPVPEAVEETPAPEPVEEAPAAPEPTPSAEAPTPVARAPRPARRAAPPTQATPSEAAPADEPDSTLRAEITLLRRAQRALADGDTDAALAHLDTHAQRFPEGVMVEEREAAHIVALGQAGQTDACRAEAERFLATHPGSPHRGRVSNACR